MMAVEHLTTLKNTQTVLESAFELSKTDPDKTLAIVTTAVKNTDPKLAAETLLSMGRNYYQQNQLTQALTALNDALAYSKNSDQELTIEILLSMGRTQRDLGNFDSAIQHLNQALEIAQKLKFFQGEVDALNLLATVFCFQGYIATSLKYLKESLVIAEKYNFTEKKVFLLTNIGVMHSSLGNHASALEALTQANRIIHQLALHNRDEVTNLIALGQLYAAMGNTKNAMDFYIQACSLGKTIGDTMMEIVAINNLAELHLQSKNWEGAKNNFANALIIAQESGLKHYEIDNLNGLGQTHICLGLYEQAIECHTTALSIARKIGNSQGEIDALLNLGRDYKAMEKPSKALEVLLTIQAMNLSDYPKANYEVHELLAEAYAQNKDYEKAFFHYQAFYSFKTQFVDDENNRKTRELSIQFEVEQAHRQADDYRIRTEIEQKARAEAESKVRERTQDLEDAQLEIVNHLALAGEYRDDDTGEHTRRVGRNAAVIAYLVGWAKGDVQLIYSAARLHDVGKMGIRDAILLKPGKLTPEEMDTIRSHSSMGARILAGGRSKLLKMAEEIALYHHERWDGTGYPHKISGNEIPQSARIVAVADVLDALTHERPYKKAWTLEAALEEIEKQSGKHFDPMMVEACLRAFKQKDIISLLDDSTEWDCIYKNLETLLYF
jgi:HD-GYP domain-containing protein (c-di-GMP phosphodiesterase class II)/Tfp pilus assembly protein PilF